MKRHIGPALLLAGASVVVAAEPIDVPNGSFEFPVVVRDEQNPFGALPYIDDWDEAALGPDDEYDQNTGVFLNTDPPASDHIANVDGKQLAFVCGLLGNDLEQQLSAMFAPGWHYRLTVAAARSAILPVGDNEKLEIALIYLDGSVEHRVASTLAIGSQVNPISLIDVSVVTPTVAANDAWASQPIGVLISPWIGDPPEAHSGGFWDLDNVRVERYLPQAGDMDDDGDVDGQDLILFNGCMTGADVKPVRTGCERAELDDDGDVDLADFAKLQANLNRPG